MDVAALIAVAATLLFTGAALVITVAEQPARQSLAPDPQLTEWRESYARAKPLQAGLVVIAAVAGVVAWRHSGDRLWLVGAAIIVVNLPWTLIVMRGVNGALTALIDSTDAPGLVARWGRLHAVRTVLGASASLAFVIQLG